MKSQNMPQNMNETFNLIGLWNVYTSHSAAEHAYSKLTWKTTGKW
jgi:hypothetical protein